MAATPIGKTRTKTVNNISPTTIDVQSWCTRVAFGEDPSVVNWPTSDYRVRRPTSGDQPRQVSAGGVYSLEGAFGPGSIVAYVDLVKVGATTFFIDEQQVPIGGPQ